MPIDYEVEYNNRARVPEHPQIFAGWERDAAAFREEAAAQKRAELGIKFGPSTRQIIDLFIPEGGSMDTLAMFVHGGYWRSLEPSMFSHMAKGLNARGIAVAVSGYDLAPQVSIVDIIAQTQRACLYLWWRFHKRVMVTGHSAGGHLATRIVSQPSPLSAEVFGRVRRVVSISGVHDLRPLMKTAMNAELRIDMAEARAESPALLEPVAGTRLVAWVGGAERSEFIRQAELLANVWAGLGAATALVEIGRAHV